MKQLKNFLLETKNDDISKIWNNFRYTIQYGRTIGSMRKQIRNMFFPTRQTDSIWGNPTFGPLLKDLVLYPYKKEFNWDKKFTKYGSDINIKDFYEKYFSSPENFIKIQNTDIWKYLCRNNQVIEQVVSAIEFTMNYKDSKEYKNMEKYWKEAYDETNSNKVLDDYIEFFENSYKKLKDQGYDFKEHKQQYEFLNYDCYRLYNKIYV